MTTRIQIWQYTSPSAKENVPDDKIKGTNPNTHMRDSYGNQICKKSGDSLVHRRNGFLSEIR